MSEPINKLKSINEYFGNGINPYSYYHSIGSTLKAIMADNILEFKNVSANIKNKVDDLIDEDNTPLMRQDYDNN